MDPPSETTHVTHCIQSSTSSEQLHAKKTSGRTRKKGGGGRAGGAGGEINKIKLEEYVGSCINWMSLYGFIGAQWHEIKPC